MLPETNASFNLLNMFIAGENYQNRDSPMLLIIFNAGTLLNIKVISGNQSVNFLS